MRTRRGFTLTELLVVVAIIAILAAILFPVFARARAKAQETTCLTEMKDIGKAVLLYAQDYDGYLPMRPQSFAWMKTLPAYKEVKVELICCRAFNPNFDPKIGSGYGFNLNLNACPKKGAKDTAYLWDGEDLTKKLTPPSAGWWTPDWIDWRHIDGANIGFIDGHVKWHTRPDPNEPKTAIPASAF